MKVMENQGKPIPEILFSEGTLMVCCMGPCFLSLLWSLYLLISAVSYTSWFKYKLQNTFEDSKAASIAQLARAPV